MTYLAKSTPPDPDRTTRRKTGPIHRADLPPTAFRLDRLIFIHHYEELHDVNG